MHGDFDSAFAARLAVSKSAFETAGALSLGRLGCDRERRVVEMGLEQSEMRRVAIAKGALTRTAASSRQRSKTG